MGGSGGYQNYNVDRSRLQEHAAASTDTAAYEAEINQMRLDILKEFNDRDVEAIRQHLDTVEDAISKIIDGEVQMLYGGLISKHTYVNGLSDVDMLVCLNDKSLSSLMVQEALKHFETTLRQRLPKTEITTGDLAVTVESRTAIISNCGRE